MIRRACWSGPFAERQPQIHSKARRDPPPGFSKTEREGPLEIRQIDTGSQVGFNHFTEGKYTAFAPAKGYGKFHLDLQSA